MVLRSIWRRGRKRVWCVVCGVWCVVARATVGRPYSFWGSPFENLFEKAKVNPTARPHSPDEVYRVYILK